VPDSRRAEEQDEDDCCCHRQFVVVEYVSSMRVVVGRLTCEHCADRVHVVLITEAPHVTFLVGGLLLWTAENKCTMLWCDVTVERVNVIPFLTGE